MCHLIKVTSVTWRHKFGGGVQIERLLLEGPQVIINSSGLDQLGVLAAFDDTTCLHHQNFVYGFETKQPMGNQQRSAASHQSLNIPHHLDFDQWIEMGRGFVQNQNGRIAEQGASNGKALALAAAKTQSLLANPGVVTVGQGLDELMQVGLFRRSNQLGFADFRPGQEQVIPNGAIKQVGLL
jgi:hypothetical protein